MKRRYKFITESRKEMHAVVTVVQSDNNITVVQNQGTFHVEYIHLRTLGVKELTSETLAKKLK